MKNLANWNQLLQEINVAGSTHDLIRRKYLQKLHEKTQRNIIAYYSGWLEKPTAPNLQINDADKNGFMNAIHQVNKGAGLDLILHTPGGETAATESIVEYLRSIFGTNIRAIVPQLAMSAGTMVACSCKQIIMGKQSSLGPIDPQFGQLAAHGVIEEFKRAHLEIKHDQSKAYVWQPIISKYPPAFIGECEKALKWSQDMVEEWLVTGMLEGKANARDTAKAIVKEMCDHALMLSHARHLSAAKCRQLGLEIIMLEDDQELQDAVLSVHHAFMHTLSATAAVKIIENHLGVAYIQQMVPTIQLART